LNDKLSIARIVKLSETHFSGVPRSRTLGAATIPRTSKSPP